MSRLISFCRVFPRAAQLQFGHGCLPGYPGQQAIETTGRGSERLDAPGFFGLGDLLQHLIETTGRGSQRPDVFLRHLFAAGLFLRLHDAGYPESHIGLPIIVGIGRHGPAAKPYHGSEEARVRFVGLEPSEIRRSVHTA